MKNNNCFVTSCDSNFFLGASALINSIRNFSNMPIVFLDTGLLEDQKAVFYEKTDRMIDLRSEFSSINFKTNHYYQKVSALSSLFAHYSGYKKIIFLDADTLLLKNVDFVFNLLNEFDIVGVRAGVRSLLESSKSHCLSDEIYPDVHKTINQEIPNLKLDGLCVNTGFFGINSYVLQEWEERISSLISWLPYFKFTDQAIFNVLLNSSNFSFKELHWQYNFAGIGDSLEDSNSTFKTILTNSRPQFIYKNIAISVPHFSGKRKPWMMPNQSAGFKIWHYFSLMDSDSSNLRGKFIIPDENTLTQYENYASQYLLKVEHLLKRNLSIETDEALVLGIGLKSWGFLRLMRALGCRGFYRESDSWEAQFCKNRYGFDSLSDLLKKIESPPKFNLVAAFDSLEYANNPIAGLRDINPLLKEDGYLFLASQSIETWYSEIIEFSLKNICRITLSEQVIFSCLDYAGFEVISSGWIGNKLWVMTKKIKSPTVLTSAEQTHIIKNLIQEVVSQSNNIFNRITNLGKLSAYQRRFMRIIQSPSQIPLKVWQKVKKYSGIPINPQDAQNIALNPHQISEKTLKIAHVGLHGNGNAGDTLLFPAVRWLFQKQVCSTHFTLIPLREPVTQETIDKINQQDALVIGGGGLFLVDSNPNEQSGWQWACPLELLEQIKVPIILFAVGYNRFRGQKDFAPIFQKNLQLLIDKSVFVGIRNRGSIEALKNYLPESLHEKINYQPCPTTILKYFYPDLPDPTEVKTKTIAVNIAFDRHHLRFGKREDEILWSIADSLLQLEKNGWKVKLFNHVSIDGDARFWFKTRGLTLEEINIGNVPPIDILRKYSEVTIAVGMRGHAQMIPFGLGRPIYSLISHDKLQFFLDDIGHFDWGVEVQDLNLSEKLVNDLKSMDNNLNFFEDQVKQSQQMLWKITLNNLNLIKQQLNI